MKTTMHFHIETIEYMIARHMWYIAKKKKKVATDLPVLVACSLINDFATTSVRR